MNSLELIKKKTAEELRELLAGLEQIRESHPGLFAHYTNRLLRLHGSMIAELMNTKNQT